MKGGFLEYRKILDTWNVVSNKVELGEFLYKKLFQGSIGVSDFFFIKM